MKKQKVDFLEVLEEKKKIVWQEIKTYLEDLTSFPSYCRIPSKYQSLACFHQKITSEYPERKGKYIRPTLVLLTAQAMGLPEAKAVRTAAAMQVSEDWILGHDDIEDDSLERRGKPCLHRLYGIPLAINAGDALHILMWKILWDNRKILGEEKAAEIAEEFYRMLTRTALGQTVEIRWTQENKLDLTDGDVLFILESKTAYYTIAGPMRLGAILAGASEKQLKAIYEFGKPLGWCFQIRDDILDLTSDFAGLKKQTGNDIYEGKRTVMLAHLFRTASAGDRKKLISIMAKKREEKTKEEVNWVIGLMKKYGSLEYGQKLAEKFAAQAEEIFEKKLGFLKHQPARSQLKAGINFILKRKY
ncbi:MAG: polyprenyl synthetase family protein [Microgenomates group bacterium]